MFKNITLTNFQSHKNSSIPLVPGINLITGTSDHGKSTIIRAFKWAILNLPDKDTGLRNDTTTENDEFSVALLLDNDITITRYKSNTENGYKLSTQAEPLKAIGRSGVPQQIQDLLNMNSINIQEQHNPYFLLNEKASSVAASFNELIGLSVMDQCVSVARDEVNNAKASLKSSDTELLRLTKELSSIPNTDIISNNLDTIENIYLAYQDVESTLRDIDSIIQTCIEYENELMLYEPLIKKCSMLMSKIDKVYKRVELYNTKHTDMNILINEYKDIVTNINAINIPDIDFDTIFKQIEYKIQEIQTIIKTYVDIDNIVSEYTEIDVLLNNISIECTAQENQLNALMAQYTDCPLCGAVLHKE